MSGTVAHAALLAARATLLTPFVVRSSAPLERLTHPTDIATRRGGATNEATDAAASRAIAHRATRLAFAGVRVMARLPWCRNTCLFRATAECLVLRALGRPAVLRIGVARDASALGVAAHAWVECAGHACLSATGREGAEYVVLGRPLAA